MLDINYKSPDTNEDLHINDLRERATEALTVEAEKAMRKERKKKNLRNIRIAESNSQNTKRR